MLFVSQETDSALNSQLFGGDPNDFFVILDQCSVSSVLSTIDFAEGIKIPCQSYNESWTFWQTMQMSLLDGNQNYNEIWRFGFIIIEPSSWSASSALSAIDIQTNIIYLMEIKLLGSLNRKSKLQEMLKILVDTPRISRLANFFIANVTGNKELKVNDFNENEIPLDTRWKVETIENLEDFDSALGPASC